MSEPARIDLEALLADEAVSLTSARHRGATYHDTRDIRAAGNEVEIAARELIARRMPAAFGVGHGHVVDRHMRTTRQLDVILFDATSSALVAQASDGTGYYPYEAVLAVGEVKTSYRRAEHPIAEFAEKIGQLASLERDRPPGATSALVRHGFGSGITVPTNMPYVNPLFSFMICVESDEFDEAEFRRSSVEIPRANRPSLVVMLDRGVVAHVSRPESGSISFDWWPEFMISTDAGLAPWETIQLRPEQVAGSALAVLYRGLGDHLSWAAVEAPDPLEYLPPVRSWPLWRE